MVHWGKIRFLISERRAAVRVLTPFIAVRQAVRRVNGLSVLASARLKYLQKTMVVTVNLTPPQPFCWQEKPTPFP